MTIRELNNRLKENQFYLSLPFWEKVKIKKVEFDSENKHFRNWVKDIWAFYLLYDHNWIENISEWCLYWENKTKWIEHIYNTFVILKNIWCNTIWL